MKTFINREQELSELARIGDKSGAQIVVVYGRRRVGKTALLERVFKNRGLIKLEGQEGLSPSEQRAEILRQLAKVSGDRLIATAPQASWSDVLETISKFIRRGKKTLYLEELQWMANYDHELIGALKLFWDNQWQHNPQFVLILCGSSPSFMISGVLKSKALYNRSEIGFRINPFSFKSARELLGSKLSLTEAMDAFLTVGGIPPYLSKLKENSSVYLSLVRNSFLPDSYFLNEYKRIFVSSFANRQEYRKVIELLAEVPYLDRQQIAQRLGRKSGGSLSEILEDLAICGFITSYNPVGKNANSKLRRFVLIDPYIRFYNACIAPQRRRIEEGAYTERETKGLKLERYRTVLGLAFERWILVKQHQLAEMLGFGAVEYNSGPYFLRSSPGMQIDLVFERKDRVTTMVEVKYTEDPVGVEIIPEFQRKEKLYQQQRTTERVLISAAGITEGLERKGYFHHVLKLEDLVARGW